MDFTVLQGTLGLRALVFLGHDRTRGWEASGQLLWLPPSTHTHTDSHISSESVSETGLSRDFVNRNACRVDFRKEVAWRSIKFQREVRKGRRKLQGGR